MRNAPGSIEILLGLSIDAYDGSPARKYIQNIALLFSASEVDVFVVLIFSVATDVLHAAKKVLVQIKSTESED